jgi:Histidine kinase-, DNA gyrase B-, and HSP90-like ATPase
VLSKGGTAPIDFTLHDEEHAFRVAQRIFELMPDTVAQKLGSFELCLLLLSAYLHDIGMTPTRDIVKRYHQYILTKSDGLLSEAEARDLQHWLDEAHGGLELPVEDRVTTVAGLDKAEELLAYYCRHRHNDWSEAWIRNHLTSAKPSLYPGWIDDLVNLCRSHHEGLQALQQPRFHVRYRGSPAQLVNLRYLAALLRVADVIEFDPERTPDVILAHRDIAPKSRAYWHKDRFSFLIKRDSRELRLDATTPDAKIHRAVLETVRQVDQELLTCNSLESSGTFILGSFKDERCSWPWPASVNAKVTEDGRFVYIDGAFRPEPRHILRLLGGVELYRDPMVAVRELLQNAFDAVKEQIARERLRFANPGDPTWAQKLGEQHKVTLSFVEETDGAWLVCEDDGVGMTRTIIERHLLVSGAPTLPEANRLEREANAHGFSVERSGQFGIGVLSYFMIADRMIITTRRSPLAGGDPDATGWRFETDGLEGFGQLTHAALEHHGTQVWLRLGSAILPIVTTRLFDFIKDVLTYVPCRIDVRMPRQPSLSFGTGWCRTLTDFLPAILNEFESRHAGPAHGLLPLHEVERREFEGTRWAKLREDATKALCWVGPITRDLGAGLGRVRVHLPYFSLSGHPSLVFMDLDESEHRVLPSLRGRRSPLTPPSAFLARVPFYSTSNFKGFVRC